MANRCLSCNRNSLDSTISPRICMHRPQHEQVDNVQLQWTNNSLVYLRHCKELLVISIQTHQFDYNPRLRTTRHLQTVHRRVLVVPGDEGLEEVTLPGITILFVTSRTVHLKKAS